MKTNKIQKQEAALTVTEQREQLKKIMPKAGRPEARISVEFNGTSITVPIPLELVGHWLMAIGITNRTIVDVAGVKVGVDIES
jgi:hypothetical protein